MWDRSVSYQRMLAYRKPALSHLQSRVLQAIVPDGFTPFVWMSRCIGTQSNPDDVTNRGLVASSHVSVRHRMRVLKLLRDPDFRHLVRDSYRLLVLLVCEIQSLRQAEYVSRMWGTKECTQNFGGMTSTRRPRRREDNINMHLRRRL